MTSCPTTLSSCRSRIKKKSSPLPSRFRKPKSSRTKETPRLKVPIFSIFFLRSSPFYESDFSFWSFRVQLLESYRTLHQGHRTEPQRGLLLRQPQLCLHQVRVLWSVVCPSTFDLLVRLASSSSSSSPSLQVMLCPMPTNR